MPDHKELDSGTLRAILRQVGSVSASRSFGNYFHHISMGQVRYSPVELDAVLIAERRLKGRVRALARQIEKDFTGRDLVVVSLLNGTILFLADLIRCLNLPLRLDFIGVSSYGGGTESRELVFTKELRLDVRERDVLLLDDILDTGRTLMAVSAKLEQLKPRTMKTCVLLDKPARRIEKIEADYVGFQIPDLFVVGYGLDFAERFRNLPFVGVLRPEVYERVKDHS